MLLLLTPSLLSLDSEIAALKQELPVYQAAAQDVDPTHDPLCFWKSHERELPTWAKAARQVLLIQPSSAASEGFFLLLRNSFGERQMHLYKTI